MNNDIGILLTNIGSPDRPDTVSVRRYLKKFLSDPHVVKIPKLIWYPILYGIILPFRSAKSAKLYQSIWTEQGSPLTYFSTQLTKKLEEQIKYPVALGMHYGNPSIPSALEQLKKEGVKKIIVLPLFPQYSETTTAVTIDKVLPHTNNIKIIRDYADHPSYIDAIAHSIEKHWEKNGKSPYLLFSFHGLPKYFAAHGDPYPERCQISAKLIAEKLQLKNNTWSLSFQSRLGRGEWLTPYTAEVLAALPARGITDIQVICPGFAVDCLETLEEIAIRGKEQFLHAGGKKFQYIQSLNQSDAHVAALIHILEL